MEVNLNVKDLCTKFKKVEKGEEVAMIKSVVGKG